MEVLRVSLQDQPHLCFLSLGHPSLNLSFEICEGEAGRIQENPHLPEAASFGHDPQNNWQKEDFSSFFFLFSSLVSVGVSPFTIHVIMEVCCDIILFT